MSYLSEFEVIETTILGLSLALFTGSETECCEWVAAQKLAGSRRDYIVRPNRLHRRRPPRRVYPDRGWTA